jgi:hypothetical protein
MHEKGSQREGTLNPHTPCQPREHPVTRTPSTHHPLLARLADVLPCHAHQNPPKNVENSSTFLFLLEWVQYSIYCQQHCGSIRQCQLGGISPASIHPGDADSYKNNGGDGPAICKYAFLSSATTCDRKMVLSRVPAWKRQELLGAQSLAAVSLTVP